MDFEAYVAARGRALLQLAYLPTGHPQDAEDLVQAALVDALRHWRRVETSGAPDAYVRRVLVNRHLTGRRRRWHGERATDFTDPAYTVHPATPDLSGQVDDRDELLGLISTLPPRGRAVIVLRYFEDLSDEQIAQTLGIAASSVRATASRALATLRTAISTTPTGAPHD